jgi:hypothetical protein
MRARTVRVCTALAAVVVLATVVVGVATGSTADGLAGVLSLAAVGVGFVVVREQPTSAVGPAMAWCAAAPLTVVLVEALAQSAEGASPPPGASLAQAISVGIWPLNVAGLVALLLVFPDGRRPGWPWRAVPVLLLSATGATVFALWGSRQVGGEVVGAPSGPARVVAVIVGLALVATCVGLGVASVVQTYRHGDERRRLQVRWLALAGVVAAALLVAGWVAEGLGAPLGSRTHPTSSPSSCWCRQPSAWRSCDTTCSTSTACWATPCLLLSPRSRRLRCSVRSCSSRAGPWVPPAR